MIEMIGYKLRITTTNVPAAEAFLKNRPSPYMYVWEQIGEENQHMHGYLQFPEYDVKRKVRNMRERIRRTLGRGNKQYELVQARELYPIEYISYMMKTGNPYVHTLPTEVVNEAKAHDEKVKASMKERKKTRRTVLQQMIDELDQQITDGQIQDGEEPLFVSVQWILDYVLDWYDGKLLREFFIVSLVQTLSCRYIPYFKDRFRDRLMDKIL